MHNNWTLTVIAMSLVALAVILMVTTVMSELARKNVRVRSSDKPVIMVFTIDKPVVFMWWNGTNIPGIEAIGLMKQIFAKHGYTIETIIGIPLPVTLSGADERKPQDQSNSTTQKEREV